MEVGVGVMTVIVMTMTMMVMMRRRVMMRVVVWGKVCSAIQQTPSYPLHPLCSHQSQG